MRPDYQTRLFFVAPDRRLMAGRVTLPRGAELPGIATAITLPLGDIRPPRFFGRTEYEVAPDERFLLLLGPNEIKTHRSRSFELAPTSSRLFG